MLADAFSRSARTVGLTALMSGMFAAPRATMPAPTNADVTTTA
jgi:hypothetical protein